MRVKLAFEASSGLGECATAGGCLEFALGTMVWLVVTAGGFAVLLFAPQNVRAARDIVRAEAERVRDERAALASFARRVRDVTPGAVQQAGSGTMHMLGSQTGTGMEKVRTAYRETVMAVDHYEEDYGEPLAQHLAVEFGQDVATAVTRNDGVPPGLTDALVAGASEGQTVRSAYLDTLATEDDRLADGADGLTTIEEEREKLDDRFLRQRGFDELHSRWERVCSLRDDLTALLGSHQERRRDPDVSGTRVPVDATFYDFLYDDLDVRHPVLADGLTLAARLDDLDHRLTRALAGRP